jgi:hypothetical protein
MHVTSKAQAIKIATKSKLIYQLFFVFVFKFPVISFNLPGIF